MVDRETLDFYLYMWIRFHEKEFREVSWQSMSITGKCCEACRTGIFSHGTSHQANDFSVPELIEIIQQALTEIPLTHRQVIKTEYSDNRSQRKKAKVMKMTLTHYRAKLCRARQRLMEIL